MKTKKHSGVALLMSLSILALLSAVGISFATAMRLGQRSAQDFFRNIQVKYFAEGGIQRAIAELKYNNSTNPAFSEGAAYKFLDTRGEGWYYKEKIAPYNYRAGTNLEDAPLGVPVTNEYEPSGILLGKGYTAHYNLKIIDAGSQINVNDTDNGNLQTLLQNLFSYLGSPLDAADANAVFNNRPYQTKDEIRQYLPGANPDVKQQKYNMIKDFITVNSYRDPNQNKISGNPSSMGKSPININTASWQVIASVLNPLLGSAVAENTAQNLYYNSVLLTYDSWNQFWVRMHDDAGLNDSDRNIVNNSVNPNRTTNVLTDTKFNFNSGGYYDVECLAIIRDSQKNVVAGKKISTNIKIFDLWNQTTKEQFRQVWENDKMGPDDSSNLKSGDISDGEIVRVTWFDSCPVISDEKWQIRSTANYAKINNSLKIGYWDDFDEEASDYYNFSQNQSGEWKDLANLSSAHLSRIKVGNDNTLNVNGPFGNVMLADGNKWTFSDCSMTIWESDNPGNPRDWWWDVGWFIFKWRPGLDNLIFQGVNIADPLLDELHTQINGVWTSSLHSYKNDKIYRIINKSNSLRWMVDYDLNGQFESSGQLAFSMSGRLKLLMMGNNTRASQWDNLRVISDTGTYTSVPLTLPASAGWGTIWGTVTLPETDAGNISFSTSIDGGVTFGGESEISSSPNGIAIGGTGTSIQYKAKLTCGDTTNYLKTPVLEDVWITYLPKTKILYWKEN